MTTFLPGPTKPPFSYRDCRTLPLPDGFSFGKLAARIGLFSRDAVLDFGARLLWRDFEDEQRRADAEPMLGWARASAAKVMVLALMYGGGDDRARITPAEFINLAWELLQNQQFPRPDSPEADAERTQIRAKFQTFLPNTTPDDADVRAAWALWNLGSEIQSSMVDTDANPRHLVRNYLIYCRFRDAYGGDSDLEFALAERQLFLTAPRLFLRAAMVLITFGMESPNTPGMVELFEDGQPREEFPLDVGFDDILAVVKRMAVRASDYRALGRTLLDDPDPRMRTAALRRLDHAPIIWLDERPGHDVLISGPARLFNALSHFLFHDAVAHVKSVGKLKAGRGGKRAMDAEVERGLAYESYLSSALDGTPVRAVPRTEGAKRPDFEWRGTRYGILIEAKAKIVPDAFDGSARCFVDALERLHGAVEQARDYVSDLDGRDSLRWVSVVVVHDPLTGERSAFRLAALRWGFLDGGPLCAAAVLETSDLEHLVLSQSADEVGEMLERLWLQARAAPPMSQPPSLDPYVESQALPVIEAGYDELFGDAGGSGP